jgi:hypothetical protein
MNLRVGRSILALAALTCLTLPESIQANSAERSIYLYDIQKVSDNEWLRLLTQWRQSGIGCAIVSLETGLEFLLDDQRQSARLTQLFGVARRFGIRIEGLVLQDPSWVLDPTRARRRLRTIIQFDLQHKSLIDSVQIDVEVYIPSAGFTADEGWARYAILVSALREELRRERSALHLTAALPWWLPVAVADYDLKMIYQSLDGILLMVYGDPGGTPVASDLATFENKVQPIIEKLPESGPMFRVGIAIYEHSSRQAMYQRTYARDLNRFNSAE